MPQRKWTYPLGHGEECVIRSTRLLIGMYSGKIHDMVSGNASNQFLPNANTTRAQAAVMLYNLMAR